MQEQGQEVKKLSKEEEAKIKSEILKQKTARRNEVKWLKEEVEYLELLAKYYSYQMQVPQLQAEFMRLQQKANNFQQENSEVKEDVVLTQVPVEESKEAESTE